MPSVADVRKAKAAMLKRRADYEFFFSHLGSPDWIAPLLEEGFLKDPPKPELVSEGRFIRFPFWPESQYLVRMAVKAPDLVVETAAAIETDNPRVQEDIVEIALRVSPRLAVKLVPKVALWIQDQKSRWIMKKFSQLVRHLAIGGERDAALSLLKEILWFDPDPKLEEKKAERAASESIFSITPEPQARAEEWEYEQSLQHAIPALAELDAIGTVNLVCSVLNQHIVLARWDIEAHRPYDGSVYWRPAIPWQSRHQTYEDLLVNSVRDTAENYLTKPSSSLEEIEAILIGRNWDIFTRIWLHLLRKFPSLAGDRIRHALTNRRFFSDHEFTHEYFHLAQEQFGSLSDEAKHKILEWIDGGPDEELLRVYSHDWDGNPVGSDIVEKRIKAWKVKKLEPLKEVLDKSKRELYATLVAEVGEPSHADLEVVHGEAEWGPTSPKTEEEIVSLDTNSILAFLRSWKPEEGWMAPSAEGLGRAFQAAVKQKPGELAAVATAFETLDPTYARALISGLSDAVKENKEFAWKPVLELCRWVIDQPVEIPGRHKRTDRWLDEGDPDWNWTRQSIAKLLREGCARRGAEIPFENRNLVWELIVSLTTDPNPSVEYEKQSSSMQPLTLSINTIRGEAMHAVMSYASWVDRHLPKERMRGFEAIPEAAQMLKAHLNLATEPTLTIRSVYGQHLAQLVFLDDQWVKDNEDMIFPRQTELRAYWEIAWSSYIFSNRCYTRVYDVLSEQYDRAIRLLRQGGVPHLEADPNESLAEHLMILYWIGRLTLDRGPLADFYNGASEDLRAHALEFVGRALKDSPELPEEQDERLKTLWMARLAAHNETAKTKTSSKELSQFALWFWSNKLDDEWALDQLIASFKSSDDIEREFFVLERLVRLSATMPLKTLIALELLIRGRDYFHGRDEAKTIIENGLHNEDSETRQRARNLANLLLSLRYGEFRDLAIAGDPKA
jgi:hypothetical protein